jgi:hypothetical protein
LHRAINERQFGNQPLIDDVDWTIHGPVELFPFFGAPAAAAVLEVIRRSREGARPPL